MAILKSKEIKFGEPIICNVSYVEEESPSTGPNAEHEIGNHETTSLKWKTKSFSVGTDVNDILNEAERDFMKWNDGKAEH